MEDIQSWYEVPSIAHFCSLFRAAFNLVDFDIEELEEALITDGAEDMGSSLIQDLIVRLLNGCLGTSEVSSSNYQMYLRRLFRKKCHEENRKNPFDSDVDFRFLPLRTKVEILHFLCDCRLEAEDVMEVLKNLEADSLRVEPLGYDDSKAAYWYFYGTRLYKEENAMFYEEEADEEKSKKKSKKKVNVKDGVNNHGPWTVVCFTEEDWRRLCNSLANATSKNEKSLYRTLKEDFLPEIPNLFAEKERQQRKRMSEAVPRRASTRIEKLKQQREEQERTGANQTESLRALSTGPLPSGSNEEMEQTLPGDQTKKPKKIDEDEWQLLRNKADRATRALLREISRDNVDLFSSFDVAKSRTGNTDPFVTEKNEKSSEKVADKARENCNEKIENDTNNGKINCKPGEKMHVPKSSSDKLKGTENKVTSKRLERNDTKKNSERAESKSNSKVHGAKISGHSDNTCVGTVGKPSQKKGRQTNNSLSSIIDTVTLHHLENGTSNSHRTSPSISVVSDEARMGMYKILEQIKNHPDAWPFLDPVDEDFAPDYYTKISQPMDLEKMEQRVSSKYYHSVEEFVADFELIKDNCKKYNGKDSEYSVMVDSLTTEFRVLVSQYLGPLCPAASFTDSESDATTESDADEDRDVLSRKRQVVPDAKKRGGLMKLAQAFSTHRSSSKVSNSTGAHLKKETSPSVMKTKLKAEDVWDTPDSSEAELKHRKPSVNKDKDKPADKKKAKLKKSSPGGGRNNFDALHALAAATEQTLKDMNKWLDDTPKISEYSSASCSPRGGGSKVAVEELETSIENAEEQYKKHKVNLPASSSTSVSKKLKTKAMQQKKKGLMILASKGKLPFTDADKEGNDAKRKLKKEKLLASLFDCPNEEELFDSKNCVKDKDASMKEKDKERDKDREKEREREREKEKEKQGRKTLDRLNSTTNKIKASKVSRPDESKLSSVIAKIKESRSNALQKQSETLDKQQLSLGTVLLSEIGSIGQISGEQDKEKDGSNEENQSVPARSASPDDAAKIDKEIIQPESTDNSTVSAKPHSATPNLSAWFKAFGAPKNQTKRKLSENETKSGWNPPNKKTGASGPETPGTKADIPWYARLEKKEPGTDKVSSTDLPANKKADDNHHKTDATDDLMRDDDCSNPRSAEERRPLLDPTSPSDSLTSSVHSPASMESIRSPSTPTDRSWGINRYSAPEGYPIRSPATPDSYNPLVPLSSQPIKVGFYQDMQSKGASPGTNVKSPSCHSSSSSNGPNSPIVENDFRHQQHHQQHSQPMPSQHATCKNPDPATDSSDKLIATESNISSVPEVAPKRVATPSLEGSEKAVDVYPLKKRATNSSPICTPTPIHAIARPTAPMQSNHLAGQPSSTDCTLMEQSPNIGNQTSRLHSAAPQPTAPTGYVQFSVYGSSQTNPLPGNLASLSQIVARIPTTSAPANIDGPYPTQSLHHHAPGQHQRSLQQQMQQPQPQLQQPHQTQHTQPPQQHHNHQQQHQQPQQQLQLHNHQHQQIQQPHQSNQQQQQQQPLHHHLNQHQKPHQTQHQQLHHQQLSSNPLSTATPHLNARMHLTQQSYSSPLPPMANQNHSYPPYDRMGRGPTVSAPVHAIADRTLPTPANMTSNNILPEDGNGSRTSTAGPSEPKQSVPSSRSAINSVSNSPNVMPTSGGLMTYNATYAQSNTLFSSQEAASHSGPATQHQPSHHQQTSQLHQQQNNQQLPQVQSQLQQHQKPSKQPKHPKQSQQQPAIQQLQPQSIPNSTGFQPVAQHSSRQGHVTGVYHQGPPNNTFEQNNQNFLHSQWSLRQDQPVASTVASASHSAPAISTPSYRPSASVSFSPSVGYEHVSGSHVGGSLLFPGLDPLASNPTMFGRGTLPRTSPWAANLTQLPESAVPQPSSSASRIPQNNIPISVQTLRAPGGNSLSSADKARQTSTDITAAQGSAFNYNVQGLIPASNANPTTSGTSGPGSGAGVGIGSAAIGNAGTSSSDLLASSSLYGRHRATPQNALPHHPRHVNLPPPAHQSYGTSANHPLSHSAFSGGPSPLNIGASAFGEFLGGQPSHPHHPLAEHAQSSALYQQLLQQRQQEELLLRNPHSSMMTLHQSGLLGAPAAYPPGFTSGLGLQQPFQGWL